MPGELSEATWTGFVKKHKLDLDDKALVKALAAVDKTDESRPEPRLKALDEVVKQIPEQVKALTKRKKDLGDKPFGLAKDQLYTMLEQAEALRKKAQAAVDAAQEEAEEEADTPVLLTSKMVPLLRELRKGQVQMHAMICTAGKNTALLIMRKPIGPSRRKLLAEAVDAKGGAKYITGECVFEDKALTFVVKSPAAQLAKRLRQALLDQADVRMKVRVRGEDGVEEDGEDEVEGQGGAQAQAHQAPSGGPASAEQLAYTQRLRKLRERYEQALEARHPESTKLRAVMGFASEKADEKKDYAAAGKALDMLEKLLSASGSPQEPGRPEVARGTVAKRAFLLERWKKIPVDLRMELGTLLKAIRADYPQVDLATLGKGIDGKLRALIDASQARLADAVDADIQAGDPRYGKTAAAIRSVRGDVASHPMVVALRENAFTAGTAFEAAFASALDEVQAALTA